jgi:transcriptional regulator with XRE-family HTH domain
MKTNESLPELLQQFQHQNKLNQHTIASLLGVSQSTYNNWINHKVPIDYKYYPIISQVCQVDIASVIPNSATVKLAANPTMENPATINALELYRTFTTPLVDIIEMLRKEVNEKDDVIKDLKEKLGAYQNQ